MPYNHSPYYENVEFTLLNGASDYDLASNQATFLSVFGPTKVSKTYASKVSIRTNQTITVKLNGASNHSITIASTDSPFVVENIELRNLYLSNASGSNAAVKLLFLNN